VPPNRCAKNNDEYLSLTFSLLLSLHFLSIKCNATTERERGRGVGDSLELHLERHARSNEEKKERKENFWEHEPSLRHVAIYNWVGAI
jgi:hypothetical protein